MENTKISLAVVLGSGLGDFAMDLPRLEIIAEDYSGIHRKITFITELDNKKVLFFTGRNHFYEGYGPEEITSNMILAAEFGIPNVLITNAAGGLHENFVTGDMMIIQSHLNLNQKLVFSPTVSPYSSELCKGIESCCKSLRIGLHKGVYCCSPGPAYESPAEIRMLKKFGCHAVGMSTVPEAFKASSLGLNAAAISVITNILREGDETPPNHNEIVEVAKKVSPKLVTLIKCMLKELN